MKNVTQLSANVTFDGELSIDLGNREALRGTGEDRLQPDQRALKLAGVALRSCSPLRTADRAKRP
jgi:hypothetical protein